LELGFPSTNLQSRSFARQLYGQLSIGQCICILGFHSDAISWETTVGPVVIYLVVHRLPDGSVDAARAYTANDDLSASHPLWITFLPELEEVDNFQNSVLILNESAIRIRYFPPLLGATAADHQITLIGQPVIKVAVDRVPASAPVPGPLLYDTTDSQLKRDTREEKLRPLFVAMRGDVSAVAAFVGSARDLAQESVLSRVHQTLSVAQVQLPCFRSEVLPLVLQCQFGPTYQTVNKRGINITAQHFMPPPKPNTAYQFSTVGQLVDCIQHFNECFSSLFVYPGSPLHAVDPLFMYGIAFGAP
jgi:hypothetical protein